MGCVELLRRLQSRRQSRPAYCQANGRRHVRQGERYSGLEGEGLGPSALRSAHTATKQSGWRCGGSCCRLLDPVPLPLLSRHHSTAVPSPKRHEVGSSRRREASRGGGVASTAFRWAHASWDNASFDLHGHALRRSCGFGRGALTTHLGVRSCFNSGFSRGDRCTYRSHPWRNAAPQPLG